MTTTRTRRSRAPAQEPVRPALEQQTVGKKIFIKKFKSGELLEDVEATEEEVMVFETTPAYVRASAGVTKNLGDYESLRLDVSITIPCYVEHVEETYQEAATWVSERLDQEINNYMPEE